MGVSNRVLIMENAYYSVISPEGCASILWGDASLFVKAAEALKLTSEELKKFNIVDDIIPEVEGGNHINLKQASTELKKYLLLHLNQLLKYSSKKNYRR